MGSTDVSIVSVYVLFKYDLGGNISDTTRLRATLHRLHGEPHVDAAVLRSWILSYLAGQTPSCGASSSGARRAWPVWSGATVGAYASTRGLVSHRSTDGGREKIVVGGQLSLVLRTPEVWVGGR